MAPKLYTIITSTRPGRKGPIMAQWFNEFANAHGAFENEIVDLAEMGLPFFNEPNHPRMQKYEHAHTKKWSAKINEGDAFVFMMPEYNSFPPAEFTNALDYLFYEWNYKPAAIFSYGGVSAGTRSAQIARLHLASMRMTPLPEGINVPNFAAHISDEGKFVANELIEASAKTVLDELKIWNDGLQTIRKK